MAEQLVALYERKCESVGTKPHPAVCSELLQVYAEYEQQRDQQQEEGGGVGAASGLTGVLQLCGTRNDLFTQRLRDADVLAIVETVEEDALHCVRGLDLSVNRVGDVGARAVARLMRSRDAALLYVDLRSNDIGAEGAEKLAEALVQNDTLLVLSVHGNPIGSAGGRAFAAAVRENVVLQRLDLGHCDLDTQALTELLRALADNRSLHAVSLADARRAGIEVATEELVGDMLARNGVLGELDLTRFGLTDHGMHILSASLRDNIGMRALVLRCNRITMEGVKPLAAYLALDPVLQMLDLSGNVIGDEGAAVLSTALERTTHLETLDVSYCGIGEPGLTALARGVQRCPTLAQLSVWGNRFGPAAGAALSRMLQIRKTLACDVTVQDVDGAAHVAQQSHEIVAPRAGVV